MPSPGTTTKSLLERFADGDPRAGRALRQRLHAELRRLTLAHFRLGHAVSTPAHGPLFEVYRQLVGRDDHTARSRGPFLLMAAAAMRRILRDESRAHARASRRWRRPFGSRQAADVRSTMTAIEVLDDAVTRLETCDPRKAALVELRFFGGLSNELAADTLGLTPDEAREEWRFCRAWLRHEGRGL